MIKLQNLLTEDFSKDEHEEIVDVLSRAQKIIERGIKKHPQLKSGKIEWLSKSDYGRYVEKREWDIPAVYITKARVNVKSDEGDIYQSNMYIKALKKNFGKGDLIYKVNVFEGAEQSDTFKDGKKALRHLEKEIKNFEFMTRLSQ